MAEFTAKLTDFLDHFMSLADDNEENDATFNKEFQVSEEGKLMRTLNRLKTGISPFLLSPCLSPSGFKVGVSEIQGRECVPS